MTWYEVSRSIEPPIGSNILYRTRSHNKLVQWFDKQVAESVVDLGPDPRSNMETFIHAYRWRLVGLERIAVVIGYANTLYLYRYEESVGGYQDKGYFWMKFEDDTIEGQVALPNGGSQFNFEKNSMAGFPYEKVTTLMQQVTF